MRIFAFLLALYVLTLTILPCVDDERGISCDQMDIRTAMPDNHREITDHCSPFCDCNCCGLPMIMEVNHFDFIISLNPVKLEQYYIPVISTRYSPPAWHPPKMS